MKITSSTCLGVELAMVVLTACGGGDGGGTPPVTVASVVITGPAAAPSLAAIGRTVSFTAEARDAGGAAISGAAIAWSSSTTATASVSGAGVVTAVANGTTTISASSGGKTSTGVVVTVAQVPATLTVTPNPVNLGALGSTRQLTATLADSAGAAMPTGAVTWTLNAHGVPNGPTITLSATGLVTALKTTTVGLADSVTASVTLGATTVTRTAVASVTQVVAAVTVSSTLATPDTLFAATRTRQFSAAARDSNANVIPAAAFSWSSSASAVATVGPATGLVTAVADGSANIQATSAGISATRPMLVRRLVPTHSVTPPSATIATNAGTQPFSGVAQDSAGVAVPMTWQSRNTGIVAIAPTTGTSITATARGNGSTFVLFSVPVGPVDSAAVMVSNQTTPTTASVQVGDDFFKSLANNTQPAVDTIAVGGMVTWTWIGTIGHSVQSTGSPSFASSIIQTSGTHTITFGAAGTYTYDCVVHGLAMSGTVVVQ